MESGKIDRRRRYTLSVIREAFFALLAEVGFAKMTVADICRCADINRGTFYLHYEDKFALLDALIDEALATVPPLEGTGAGALCQRPPANDDYYLLYSDDDAYARVAQRVVVLASQGPAGGPDSDIRVVRVAKTNIEPVHLRAL